MKDLRERTIRGGAAKVVSQAANFTLRLGSVMILGRLLEPKDFGLVGMVTAIIGVLNLFRDFGLSTATVQRNTVTDGQISTLFWINLLVGAVLGIVSAAIAPLVAVFYHEPRLVLVTVVLASGFIFNAAGVQHGAILQRQMRFTPLAVIDIVSLVASTAVGIGMALRGFGYWSLVGMTIVAPIVSTAGVWFVTKWVPAMPSKEGEIWSLMRFGGTVTLNGLVVYVAYNMEKVLLGRYWGAAAVGIYGRAYQLINIPTDNLNSAAGGVAFAALSRLQDDPQRLKNYFLKAYSMLLALTVPITVICAIFAKDLILVLLGPKWAEAVPIFRLLAPTMLIFAMINPLWWLHYSIGLVKRSLTVAAVISVLVVIGYLFGLSHGPQGVAFAYSAVLTLWAIPHLAWCVRGTMLSLRELLMATARPLFSSLLGGALALAAQFFYGPLVPALPRLVLGVLIVCSVYLGMLLYVMGQKELYLDLLRGLLKRPAVKETALVSV
jgi:O-antigen/teichoic acid export membrane protein